MAIAYGRLEKQSLGLPTRSWLIAGTTCSVSAMVDCADVLWVYMHRNVGPWTNAAVMVITMAPTIELLARIVYREGDLHVQAFVRNFPLKLST